MKKQAGTAMWTAAALAASLLLGACGSDGGSKDKIDGAEGGTGESSKRRPSPSKSSGPSEHKGPDEIKLAKDAKNVFEDTGTGDPKKDEVLADNQARINAVDRVITTGKEPDLVKVYAKGKSLLASNKYILDFADDGMSWAGVTRYYDQKVEFTGKSDARVTFCADESKAQNKVIKTGKLEPNDAGDQNYVFASFHTKRNSDGVWQAVSGSSQRGAKQCMK
ncbi:hypothetical protein [Streptomyces sp. NPDC006784]|uniref:hypothetical protein n=1 Tax=Streptomyces sp. NPDC006784 TaxID=3364764 RepID=UPI003694B3D4